MRNSLKKAAALAFAIMMLLTLIPAGLATEDGVKPETKTSEWVVPGISDGGALLSSIRNYSDIFDKLMAEEDLTAFSEMIGQYLEDEGFWAWASQALEAGTLTEEQFAALNEKIALAEEASSAAELAITGPTTVPVGGTITLTSDSGSATSQHTWTTSNSTRATVTGNGQTALVTGVQAGSTVTITHRYGSQYGYQRSENYQVTVVTSITGPDTVAKGGTITLTSVSGSIDDASLHTWTVSPTQYATVTGNGRTAVLAGIAEGTVTVTHTFKNSADGTEYTDTFQVTVKEPEEEEAQVFYLKTPTSDPNSNSTSEWCDTSIGNGKVETTGGTWVDDKNLFNPSAYIKGMTSGMVKQSDGSWLLPRDTYKGDYESIYTAYKAQLEKELGVTLNSADDIEAIYLVPYKISKNNSSTPDKHIDCTIRVKLKGDLVFAAVFWVTMPDGTVKQVDAKNYSKGSEVAKTDKAPTASTGAYPAEMVYVDGITYLFDGWYNEANQKISDSAWPYAPSTDELADGTVNFYAKYVPKQTTVTVRKSVVSTSDADKQKDFTFTYTDSDGNEQTFTLKHNTEMTLPVKVGQENFAVTETEDSAFNTSYVINENGAVNGRTAEIEKIEDGANYVITFTNTRNDVSLEVTKQVGGNFGDRSKPFTFSMKVDGGNQYDLKVNGESLTKGDSNDYTFSLKHGESIQIDGIPVGKKIELAETNADGYTVQFGEQAEITTGARSWTTGDSGLTANMSLTVTNTRNVPVDTGVLLDSLPYILIIACVAAIGAFIVIRRRKSRED